MSIYDINVLTNKGENITLEKYKGKVLLIVNTATKCGFTPQYICEMRYKTTFDRFKKIDVNGDNEHELYHFLKTFNDGKFSGKIKWNFTKFLVDREGNVVGRFGSMKSPKKIEEEIVKVLGE